MIPSKRLRSVSSIMICGWYAFGDVTGGSEAFVLALGLLSNILSDTMAMFAVQPATTESANNSVMEMIKDLFIKYILGRLDSLSAKKLCTHTLDKLYYICLIAMHQDYSAQ